MTDDTPIPEWAMARAKGLIQYWWKRHSAFQHIEDDMARAIAAAHRDGYREAMLEAARW